MEETVNNMGINGIITNIQKYSIHDGPGIRTTIFFKGCPLSCLWCHNPEGISFREEKVYYPNRCIGCGDCIKICPSAAIKIGATGMETDKNICILCGKCADICPARAMEILGYHMTLAQVMDSVLKDLPFYEASGGGVTLSGGEPAAQKDFALAILAECKKQDIHTALDTSGCVPWESLAELVPFTDLFLYDIKHLDDEVHHKYTGESNKLILENLNRLVALIKDTPKKIWLRMPVMPGINDDEEHMRRVGFLMKELGLQDIYLLPYHNIAKGKYERLGFEYRLNDLDQPGEEHIGRLQFIIHNA